MGIDEDLVNVLRDLVQFLEHLCEVNLPSDVEDVRSNLLQRSKSSLEAQSQRSTSPEPYLTMNAGRGKSLMLQKLLIPNEDNVTEYIDPEEQSSPPNNRSSQGYYEWFSDLENSSKTLMKEESEDEDTLLQIYRSYSTEITKNECRKCGTVKQKDERMIIGLFGNRSYWLGLVGSHLLVYPSENEKQPSDVYSIRGYSARPAPNAMPRDPKQGKSAFEVFSPGCKTLLFIAKSPNDMEEWVAAICNLGPVNNSPSNSEILIAANSQITFTNSDEQYHDIIHTEEKVIIQEKPKDTKDSVSSLVIEKLPAENYKMNQYTENVGLKKETTTIPVLHARNSRRLPPLPQENLSTYEPLDDNYDGDGIYHKIEDLQSSKKRNNTYQNVKKSGGLVRMREDEEYDDIQGTKIASHNSDNLKQEIITYDDIKSIDIRKNSKESPEETPCPKIKRLFSRGKKDSSPKEKKDKNDSVKKDPEEKKKKKKKKKKASLIETSQSEPVIFQELPAYDDISDLSSQLKRQDNNDMDEGNYNSPPAPRPILPKSPEKDFGEMYDDISQLGVSNEKIMGFDEVTHYQVPRSQEIIKPGQLAVTVKEELYDDVAILAEARARQRDSGCSSSSYEKTGSNVVRALSRLASGKRSKLHENSTEKIDNWNKSADEEFDNLNGNSSEQGDVFKFNKLKKLVNKIEFSLSGSTKPMTIGNKNHDVHEVK